MKITAATKITIARIVLIFPTIVMYIISQVLDVAENVYVALTVVSAVLLALVLATDIVDGIVARKTHTVSDLGKFLDPLADKVAIVVVLFLIVLFNRGLNVFPYNALIIAILAGVMTSRELIIGIFRAVAASKNIVLAADIFGKVKTVLLDIAVVALVLAPLHVVIGWIATVVYYVGAILTVYSGANYMLKNKSVLHNAEEQKEE
ncbi:MAG: CDP-diacylglycerol--glycerol-3-phosphate 3-phosphatidyltransferase [Clostridia bacterium]|nr:CDP-diacylglycerol--glycerol-3-phosphate 3-phosphatidyltransferase [Clostridia bacterium]